MKRKLFILFFLIRGVSFAQSDLTEKFAFSVKTIDDFIDRFDFIRNTDFEKYFQANMPGESLNREKLVLSLFNFKNRSFKGNADVKNFIKVVTDSILPKYIYFSDSSWYAEVDCKIICNKKPESLVLILKVEQDSNRAFKWSIVSAHSDFLAAAHSTDSLAFVMNNEYMKNRISDQSRYFLHPVSHALDFMNMDQLFTTGKSNFEKYIYDGPRSYELENLIKKVKNSEIKFVQVNTIAYHFLQIDGWIVIVDYFNRNELNSGWLINTLLRADDEQKRIYLEKHLGVRLK